jgi:hypothetical protein
LVPQKEVEMKRSATTAARQKQIRRGRQGKIDRQNESANRQNAKGGGRPNHLGVTQGQNGEQGNTIDPRNTVPQSSLEH